MKKFLMIASAALLSAQPLMAQEAAITEQAVHEQVYELEEGAMSIDGFNALDTEVELKGRNEAAIIGGIIGGIIGAIAADQFDRDHHNRGRQVVCYAQNRRGEVFRVIGSNARLAQNLALDKCERRSLRCRPMGCQAIRR